MPHIIWRPIGTSWHPRAANGVGPVRVAAAPGGRLYAVNPSARLLVTENGGLDTNGTSGESWRGVQTTTGDPVSVATSSSIAFANGLYAMPPFDDTGTPFATGSRQPARFLRFDPTDSWRTIADTNEGGQPWVDRQIGVSKVRDIAGSQWIVSGKPRAALWALTSGGQIIVNRAAHQGLAGLPRFSWSRVASRPETQMIAAASSRQRDLIFTAEKEGAASSIVRLFMSEDDGWSWQALGPAPFGSALIDLTAVGDESQAVHLYALADDAGGVQVLWRGALRNDTCVVSVSTENRFPHNMIVSRDPVLQESWRALNLSAQSVRLDSVTVRGGTLRASIVGHDTSCNAARPGIEAFLGPDLDDPTLDSMEREALDARENDIIANRFRRYLTEDGEFQLGFTPGDLSLTRQLFILDIEGPLHPKCLGDFLLNDRTRFSRAIDAFKRRIRVARSFLPRAKLALYGFVVPREHSAEPGDAIFSERMAGYREAADLGLFELDELDYLSPVLYVHRLDNPNDYRKVEAWLRLALESSASLSSKPLAPLLHMKDPSTVMEPGIAQRLHRSVLTYVQSHPAVERVVYWTPPKNGSNAAFTPPADMPAFFANVMACGQP